MDIIFEQVLDFGFLHKENNPYSPAKPNQFIPAVTPIFNNFQGYLSKDETLRYYLEIIADNYRPKSLIIIEVFWNGDWSEDEMEKNLRIEIIQSQQITALSFCSLWCIR